MAIYRAVGQNTYEFVMKTQFSLGTDLTNPGHAMPAPAINITHISGGSNKGVGIYAAGIMGSTTAASGFSIKNTYASTSSNIGPSTVWYGSIAKPCVVDGDTYYGYDAATYRVRFSETNGNISATVGLGPAKYKVIKYQAATGTIVTEEYTYAGMAEDYISTGASKTYEHYFTITIPKTADDLILWIETEFPEE